MPSPWQQFKKSIEDLSQELPEIEPLLSDAIKIQDRLYQESVDALKEKQRIERERRKGK